ncbi:MAG: ATP-grasp domain-containing protein [Corynebacterium sp.]|uniref:ATP-grasp domain-containing protein n=1 Tax=Corynebacterium sp. TaxID=1720 RepID=UPI0026DD7E92|nr:ATP-grasp domain-containing protein [Corynebacterium sp.]MDO5099242.1 ATP-grasp domain-containing protein [Corynebacterium sp.]
MNILITGVGGPAGRALVKQLATSGHSVIGVDMQEVPVAEVDAFELVPAAHDPEMINHLARLVQQYQVDVLIPTVADELLMVAKAANVGVFADAHVVISAPEAVEKCFDKLFTMRALRESGVSVPPFGLPSDFKDAEDVFAKLGEVIITKPRVARGGRGFKVHRSPESFNLAAYDDSYIIQAFASGEEYAPMVHMGTKDGEELVAVVHKKREDFCGTEAPLVQLIDTSEALDVAMLAVRACRALKLVGPVDLDIRRMADGRPVVLEVNARFGANSSQAPEILNAVLSFSTE